MMVAGESSGETYGAAMARALRARDGAMEIFGCGGEAMRQAGVNTLVDAQEIAVMGFSEALGGLYRAWRSLGRLAGAAAARRPSGAVLIDSPDFNLRLASRLKRLGVPVIYFVSPQVWAWRSGRLEQLKATIQKMLCIFDFEQEIYQRAGIPVEFVGHPLVDLEPEGSSREEFLAATGLDSDTPTIAILPGSRRSEIAHHWPTMLEAMRQVALRRRVQFVISVARPEKAAEIRAQVRRRLGGQARVGMVTGAAHDALDHSTVAVVASGTVTVEAALRERPMVVIYRVSPVTAWLARRLVRVPFYSMVNLLAGREVVPELIQADFTPQKVAERTEFLLDHPESRANMVEGLRAVKQRLGPGGAIERAASAVWRELALGGASPSAA